jgi:hypothetical protein
MYQELFLEVSSEWIFEYIYLGNNGTGKVKAEYGTSFIKLS